jgi:hypothetical protein
MFTACAAALFFLLFLASSVRQNRRRQAKLDAISLAPLPHLPLSFRWDWWALVLFMALSVFSLALTVFVCAKVGPMWPMVIPMAPAIIGFAYHVYGYLRFAVKGPSFILDATGIAFAGHYLHWRDVSSIDYEPSGRTPFLRFRHTGGDLRGFSAFDQFNGKTSFSAFFISDPDELVGWSRRLQGEDLKRRGACLEAKGQV